MEGIKLKARQAKQRLKSNFWEDCKKQIDEGQIQAKTMGLNERKVNAFVKNRVKLTVKGEKQDDFYLKVKNLLDAEGEVSDAIGRLTDGEVYKKLSYEEKQRYNLELSAKYLKALEKYRKEKEMSVSN